ncbi:MAG TPA: DNA mismatch repair endonuclease MutL [Terriglobales bacterium]|nr:DNA mismatch repair endonuclease MutL [Terriglobales bacterium]
MFIGVIRGLLFLGLSSTMDEPMARIHILPEHVANKIAAGEVVERPASVVKELLENALDAGAARIRVEVEAGGKKLIRVTDDGSGMVRDDALLAFERHATSKIKDAEDLLTVATLGFRGEALPSIASVSRLRLETRAASDAAGTVIEIAGGKMHKVEDAGLPAGTSIAVRDLFFNTPARKKFLRAEATELSHIAQLVTHYALAHPEKHVELHSSANAMLVVSPVRTHAERLFQIFGKEMLEQMVPVTAEAQLERVGLPAPPSWVIEKRKKQGEEYEAPEPGALRVRGFVSRPELQKLNRNSIFVFVNGRLIRDRLLQHALSEAYRNILPGGVFPVVLLFLEMPALEVDVNVHPSKTEVRFRQQGAVHDFVRDTVRAALVAARPVPQFTREIAAQPTAAPALTPGARGGVAPAGDVADFALRPDELPPLTARFAFQGGTEVEANAALPAASVARALSVAGGERCGGAIATGASNGPAAISSLKPLGQVRDSFILAVAEDGLWIVDQHVAHERVLFERVLRQRAAERVEGQRLLMPLIVELTPAQQAVFQEIADELRANGFEVEPFGSRTLAVKTAPAGVDASDIERLLNELLEGCEREEQAVNLEKLRTRIAASIACHAAIKVNMPLDAKKMEWLLSELAKTECPFSCPHGRPVLLRYSLEEIQRAFKRI